MSHKFPPVQGIAFHPPMNLTILDDNAVVRMRAAFPVTSGMVESFFFQEVQEFVYG